MDAAVLLTGELLALFEHGFEPIASIFQRNKWDGLAYHLQAKSQLCRMYCTQSESLVVSFEATELQQ